MKPILVDTNAYTAFLRGVPEIVTVFSSAEKLYVNSIVLGELLGGFAAGSREGSNRAQLTKFLDSPRVDVYSISQATADSYALVYVALRRKGVPIPSNDMWIAASALEHGASLLSLDSHFAHVEGLRHGRCIEDFLP